MQEIDYSIIILSAFLATSSPGPATLAIAGASMGQGRFRGLCLAAGVLTGSLFWSLSAAFGLAAILHANVWIFELLRYFGAFYLLFLAFKSLRSALGAGRIDIVPQKKASAAAFYSKGLLIHLTNPKAILFFGALYSVGLPPDSGPSEVLSVVLAVGTVSATVFLGYAVLFSNKIAADIYSKCRAAFEWAFSVMFGYAGLKLLAGEIEG